MITTFIIWIDSIARLGQISTALDKTESQAKNAIEKYAKDPFMGCHKLIEKEIPDGTMDIYAKEYGFLSAIGFSDLQDFCKKNGVDLYILKCKGELLTTNDVVAKAQLSKVLEQDKIEEIKNSFYFIDEKKYTDDPVFGLETLGEVAAKALSPGVNDPGTAIMVMSSLTRGLSHLFKNRKKDVDVKFNNLYMKEVPVKIFVKAGFELIRKYGSADILVAKRIQKSLHYIKSMVQESEKEDLNSYIRNCYHQASNELANDFDQEDLKNYKLKLEGAL